MADDFHVIADVSTSLVEALKAGLAELPQPVEVSLSDLQDAAPTGLALTVTLYEILEDPAARNRPHEQEPRTRDGRPAVRSRRAPMALLLRYLVTPWGASQESVQAMVGLAMRTLYDNAVLAGTRLAGALLGGTESLKITLAPLTLEERTRVWHAFQQPYRLSLNYEVRVVNLRSAADRVDGVVGSRVLDTAAADGAR